VNPVQKLYSHTKVSSQTPPGRTRDEPARGGSVLSIDAGDVQLPAYFYYFSTHKRMLACHHA